MKTSELTHKYFVRNYLVQNFYVQNVLQLVNVDYHHFFKIWFLHTGTRLHFQLTEIMHIASLAAHKTSSIYKPMEISITRSPQH